MSDTRNPPSIFGPFFVPSGSMSDYKNVHAEAPFVPVGGGGTSLEAALEKFNAHRGSAPGRAVTIMFVDGEPPRILDIQDGEKQ